MCFDNYSVRGFACKSTPLVKSLFLAASIFLFRHSTSTRYSSHVCSVLFGSRIWSCRWHTIRVQSLSLQGRPTKVGLSICDLAWSRKSSTPSYVSSRGGHANRVRMLSSVSHEEKFNSCLRRNWIEMLLFMHRIFVAKRRRVRVGRTQCPRFINPLLRNIRLISVKPFLSNHARH